jgi:hypothetical protein
MADQIPAAATKKKLKLSQQEITSSTTNKSSSSKKRKRPSSNNNNNPMIINHVQTQLGVSMNRPSIYLPLDSLNFNQRFGELWAEHVDGFVGLSRRNHDKDVTMEWQVRLEEKRKKSASSSIPSHSTKSFSSELKSSLNVLKSNPTSSNVINKKIKPDERLRAEMIAKYRELKLNKKPS